MQNVSAIEGAIPNELHLEHPRFNWTGVGGGDTHSNYRLNVWSGVEQSETFEFFVKSNQVIYQEVLKSEYDSLCEIAELTADESELNYSKAILFVCDDDCFLVMEYKKLTSLNAVSAAELGVQLAKQHRISASQFGWQADNFIGLSKQSNSWNRSWQEFYKRERLTPQLDCAQRNGLPQVLVTGIESLIKNLQQFFADYKPEVSLLHGDLWSGNVAQLGTSDMPIFFDPAPYFGDREADIAMTELFGCFPQEFYAGYQEVWPLDKGYRQRKHLYNLYHALNHFNLFGAGYTDLVAQQLVGLDV